MSRSDEERLDDIREHCARVGRLVGRGRRAFDGDEAVRFAAERSLEIIGEAATVLGEGAALPTPTSTGTESVVDVDWHRVSRMRILLAHHYHRVDPEQVWTIAVDHIPALLASLGPLSPEEGA